MKAKILATWSKQKKWAKIILALTVSKANPKKKVDKVLVDDFKGLCPLVV